MKYIQYIKHLVTQNKSQIVVVLMTFTYILSFIYLRQSRMHMSVYELLQRFTTPIISALIIIPCFLIMIDHGILFYNDTNVIIRFQSRFKWGLNQLVCLLFDCSIYAAFIMLLLVSGVICILGVYCFNVDFILHLISLFLIIIIGLYSVGIVYILLSLLSENYIAFAIIVFLGIFEDRVDIPIIARKIFPNYYQDFQINILVYLSNGFLHLVAYFMSIIIISALLYFLSINNREYSLEK